MKKILLLIMAFMPVLAFAQDNIRTIEGKSITAKILEIGEDSIAYKDYSNQDGPTYRLSIANIASITLENGDETIYNNIPDGFKYPSKLEVYRNDLYGDGVEIPESSLIYVLGQDEYDSFNAGLKFKRAGRTLSFVGLGLTVAGGALLVMAIDMAKRGEIKSGNTSMAYISGYSIGLGVSCLIASIPFSAVGRGKINAVVDNYNENHHASLNFGVTNNGVGFALAF